jgi:hypothetical protein
MSNKKSLWITRRLSEKTLERAQIDYDCVINFDDLPISQQELAEPSYKTLLFLTMLPIPINNCVL